MAAAAVVLALLGGGVAYLLTRSHAKAGPSPTQTVAIGGVAPLVTASVRAYGTAIAHADGSAICATMSPQAQLAFVSHMASFAQGGCPALAQAAAESIPSSVRRSFTSIRVVSEKSESNGQVIAEVAVGGGDIDVPYERVGTRWLIAPGGVGPLA